MQEPIVLYYVFSHEASCFSIPEFLWRSAIVIGFAPAFTVAAVLAWLVISVHHLSSPLFLSLLPSELFLWRSSICVWLAYFWFFGIFLGSQMVFAVHNFKILRNFWNLFKRHVLLIAVYLLAFYVSVGFSGCFVLVSFCGIFTLALFASKCFRIWPESSCCVVSVHQIQRVFILAFFAI